MLFGRNNTLKELQSFKGKKTASLIVIKGRRRIGKSSLVEELGKSFKNFYQFQGLPPRKDLKPVDQLKNFAEQLSVQFKIPKIVFENWNEAFAYLAKLTVKEETLLLFDEISWMGTKDPDFAGKLKIAWDIYFKKNTKLVLILCGSVSSWIEENILNNTSFVGRISSVFKLKELSIAACYKFWNNNNSHFRKHDIIRMLSITGGIPKYLEEIQLKDSINQNIKRLCFSAEGYLFGDFDRIFSDIFGSRSAVYLEIISHLITKPLAANDIFEKLHQEQNGETTKYLVDLEQSGFIARYYNFKPDGKQSKISFYRISDNYLRFYLKFILPNKERIEKNSFTFKTLEDLPGWHTVCGLQFENLLLNRMPEVTSALSLKSEKILSASPYVQTKTTRSLPCQIDLLIACKTNTYYVCEAKFNETVNIDVIEEVKAKIKKLKFPKNSSFRPVLIYSGELDRRIIDEDYFDRILDVGEMLTHEE